MTRSIRLPVALTVMAVILVFAAKAFACTPQSNIFLDTLKSRPGQVVSGHGVGFGPAAAPGVTSVQVRLDTVSGPVLWSGSSAANGYFAFSFTVSPMALGYHVIVAIPQAAPQDLSRAVLQVAAPVVPRPKTHLARPKTRAGTPKAHSAPPKTRPVSSPHAAPPVSRRVGPRVPASVTPAVAVPIAHRAPTSRRYPPSPRPARKVTRVRSPAFRTHVTVPLPSDPWSAPARVEPQAKPAQPALPWVGVGLVALGLLALGGAGGAFVALRLRPPPPVDRAEAELPVDLAELNLPVDLAGLRLPVDLTELELQEMLMEAMADVGLPTDEAGTNGNGKPHHGLEDALGEPELFETR